MIIARFDRLAEPSWRFCRLSRMSRCGSASYEGCVLYRFLNTRRFKKRGRQWLDRAIPKRKVLWHFAVRRTVREINEKPWEPIRCAPPPLYAHVSQRIRLAFTISRLSVERCIAEESALRLFCSEFRDLAIFTARILPPPLNSQRHTGLAATNWSISPEGCIADENGQERFSSVFPCLFTLSASNLNFETLCISMRTDVLVLLNSRPACGVWLIYGLLSVCNTDIYIYL